MRSRPRHLLAALGYLMTGAVATVLGQTPDAVAPGRAFPSDSAVLAILRERVASGRAPGIVVGLLEGDRRRVLAHGTAGDASPRPIDGRTIFEIGSVTKVFTGILLAEMTRRGEVRLDQPVAELMPRGTRIPSQAGRQITLGDLATQRSGLPRAVASFDPGDPENPLADLTPRHLYDFLATHELRRDPGVQYEYSNLGFALLGHALEVRAERPFERLLVEQVLDPLHLRDTRITLSADQRSRFATPHDAMGEPVRAWDFALPGSGAIRATADDLLTFLAANLVPAHERAEPIVRALSEARRPRASTNGVNEIGLGWQISHTPGMEIVWHNGATAGSTSFIALDTLGRRAVVVLANSGVSADDIGFHLLNPARALRPPPVPRRRVAVALDPATLDRYIGDYVLSQRTTISITRVGEALYARVTGQDRIRISPESSTRFFYRVLDAQLTFELDPGGGPARALTLHQNGRDRRGDRRP